MCFFVTYTRTNARIKGLRASTLLWVVTRIADTNLEPANNRLIKFKISLLYEEYNKNQLLFTMSQIALFRVKPG